MSSNAAPNHSQPKISEAFHPDSNLPGCMMPDGGDCCAGHAAVCEDWHKQRQRIQELEGALREMLNTFQPFTMKPVGAPNSPVRLGQEHQIDVQKRARAALSSKPAGETEHA